MLEIHQEFWNEWAEAYRGFSETVEAYREAQQELARLTIAVLGEGQHQKALTLLDVGGGAGNLISPLLDALAARRGSLKGVAYTLTDGAKEMTVLARGRLGQLSKIYPDVEFRVLHADTLADGFIAVIGPGPADVVVNSWNIEYYPPEMRQKIVDRLVRLVHPQGVVAFSSTVRMPAGLTLRDVLMPLGRAQVIHGLLTGGPGKMDRALSALKQIARFGTAATASHFPEKPTPVELQELARQAGLVSIVSAYHLYGASVMVAGRKDKSKLPEVARPAIAQVLAGQEGYEDFPETITFWRYFQRLLRAR